MPDSYGLAFRMYDRWLKGESKNKIEREMLDDPKSHGKAFSRIVREELGIETEDEHPMIVENKRLKLRIKELEAKYES